MTTTSSIRLSHLIGFVFFFIALSGDRILPTVDALEVKFEIIDRDDAIATAATNGITATTPTTKRNVINLKDPLPPSITSTRTREYLRKRRRFFQRKRRNDKKGHYQKNTIVSSNTNANNESSSKALTTKVLTPSSSSTTALLMPSYERDETYSMNTFLSREAGKQITSNDAFVRHVTAMRQSNIIDKQTHQVTNEHEYAMNVLKNDVPSIIFHRSTFNKKPNGTNNKKSKDVQKMSKATTQDKVQVPEQKKFKSDDLVRFKKGAFVAAQR